MPDQVDFDDVADELYSLDPSEFVAARKDAVARARKAGDRKTATAIGALRKPTVVAWMVNLLVREEPEDVAELFDLGDSLREAQRRSAADELKELSGARQQAIRALTRRAVKIAAEHGKPGADDAEREIGQTLNAALADPDVGERVRAGRVVTAESYSGFGPAMLALAPELPDEEEEPEDEETADEEPDTVDQKALDEAREQLEEAKEDEASARADAESARAEAESADENLAEVKERLARLRSELHEAEEQEAEARRTVKSADREARRLKRVLTDAQARTEEAQNAVDSFRREWSLQE
ncbi:hypothetical protein HQ346_20115 [Rhodococcus sp. BP-252]|uniref:hypothetical protein n=1 Tax=unclassified Rhodococcus (in: high G+C Gram-positive bacteria) TaxID=192944 RepID=UPI001C9B98E1|nr:MULTISPECIES: hypothetical protein [unclassified Rhodococcus (in: high G+C Gram-positive bacteria)]MBY6414003.1 hypothetical protein [Rhodococcus sp. BP-320]MBY6418764.1 hypothetical protein [Rhodococcus sp. BP-321]MBY6423355.1 hypothetical protein [Rhodococcus sp. BP-324]MBY6428799.1 hypothetical protein [Rhodococcus sp. BP-323]MBY6433805.1 hypothetical protein [Rhodococcus sp. BP-322]